MRLPVENKRTVVYLNGINSDIIAALEGQYKDAVEQVRPIASRFAGYTPEETARNVWHYLRHKCKYQKDEPGRQDILMPNRVIDNCNKGRASGDCKSFALFANAIFGALGYPCGFRYASYDRYNPTPSHVYSYIQKPGGGVTICDGVYQRFNSEAAYQYKYDHPMQISVLSGLNPTKDMIRQHQPVKLEVLITKVKPGGLLHTVVSNAMHRKAGTAVTRGYPASQLATYVRQLQHIQQHRKLPGMLGQLVAAEITAAQSPNFTGDLWHRASHSHIQQLQHSVAVAGIYGDDGGIEGFSLKKVFKGAKKVLKQVSIKNALKGLKAVTFLPMRKAFQALVVTNFRGIASRLKNHPSSKEKVLNVWSDKFGGSKGKLNAAISKGATNKPLLGGAIKGHDDELAGALTSIDGGLGVAPIVAAPAIIGAATPILVFVMKMLKKDGVPEVEGGAGVSDSFLEQNGGAGESLLDKASDFIQKALPMAQATGVLPEPPRSMSEQVADKSLPPDLEGGASLDASSIGKYALPAVAVAAGLYFVTRKK